MTTYPNQKLVTVHKKQYTQDFMQVAKAEWMPAFADLKRGTFGVYLYMCGNMNNYRFGLSSVALQNALGISDSTYRRAIKELKEKGYLVHSANGKSWDFYPTPQFDRIDASKEDAEEIEEEYEEELIEPVVHERAAAPAAYDPSVHQAYRAPSSSFSYSYPSSPFGWED